MAPSMVPSYDRTARTKKYQAYPYLVTMHQAFLAPVPATMHSASLDLIPLAPYTASHPSSDLPSSLPCSLLPFVLVLRVTVQALLVFLLDLSGHFLLLPALLQVI